MDVFAGLICAPKMCSWPFRRQINLFRLSVSNQVSNAFQKSQEFHHVFGMTWKHHALWCPLFSFHRKWRLCICICWKWNSLLWCSYGKLSTQLIFLFLILVCSFMFHITDLLLCHLCWFLLVIWLQWFSCRVLSQSHLRHIATIEMKSTRCCAIYNVTPYSPLVQCAMMLWQTWQCEFFPVIRP
jgi:hypothetical protein